VRGDVVQQIQVDTLEVAFGMILHHHNGDLSLTIDETLVNFTKTKHPTKGERKEEQRERTRVIKRQNPKGVIKGQL
jgi:hypothetical protein